MSIVNETASPEFRASLHLLSELHHLHLAGHDESSDADQIREAMTDSWWKLSGSEQQRLEGLSADLYSIGADRPAPQHISDKVANAFEVATQRKDWDEALAVLRQHERELPPLEVAALRGVAWGTRGYHEIASLFFAEASRLKPTDIRYECLYLRALARSGALADAKAKAIKLAANARDDPLCLLLAADVLLESGGDEPMLELLRQVADYASRGFKTLEPLGLSEEFLGIAGAGLLSGAISFDLLGKAERARELLATAETLLRNTAAFEQRWPLDSSETCNITVDTLVALKKNIPDPVLPLQAA